ncbi:endospore coat-associated protein YheC [Paenibacillus sp. J23TS9]|uniref:YheC/YheD family endospore coat-associated protein n=1 Tax=Paenibacillus sp. J23TS9 TaxID=2807193 RepID=UPI001B12965E|nr:YheC/YheD family protein [Paenibacillus sp. J23TS9]GIP27865.1 endospore coat-associated protein YheC [Paenibacillus sp. J23TS9]
MPIPVLGILTLYMNEQKHLEEKPVYQKMIIEGRKVGLDVFVFTPMDVNESKQKIYALEYDAKKGTWGRSWRSFPHMIYDRCRIQKGYRFTQLLQFRRRYSHLLFLNRPLRNKWTIYEVLSRKPEFKKYLPETHLYHGFTDAHQMLKRKPVIFLKPINGTGGRGILRIERLKENSQYYIQGRNQQRKIIAPQKIHASRLGSVLHSWNMKDRYLVQEGIPIDLPDGRVHDYRMLVQKNREGIWQLTGIAGRVGAPRSITSNLHGGGHAVTMNSILDKWIEDAENRQKVEKRAEKLGIGVAAFLEGQYGALCELALDLAINKKGHIYLLEVNPKPAREVFSQIGDADMYRQAIVRPLEYAVWLYGQREESKKTNKPQ